MTRLDALDDRPCSTCTQPQPLHEERKREKKTATTNTRGKEMRKQKRGLLEIWDWGESIHPTRCVSVHLHLVVA